MAEEWKGKLDTKGSFSGALEGGIPGDETAKEALTRKMGGQAPWYKETTTPRAARDTMKRQGYEAQRIDRAVRWGID